MPRPLACVKVMRGTRRYLTTRNTNERRIVAPRYILNFPKSFIFSDAQAITIVTDEVMSTTVLKNAIGTLSSSDPTGHSTEPTRSRM